MSMRRFHHNTPNRLANFIAAADTTSTLRSLLYTGSISTRSAGSVSVSKATLSSSWSTPLQSRTSFTSRKYTSSSSPTSSSSTSTTVSSSSAARILAEESSHVVATAASSSSAASAAKAPLTFHEEMTKVRFSFNWWKEWTIIMGVFAVTGSSTVMVVKPVLKDVFKLDGSMKEGPWSFRIAYLGTTLPLYSCILLTVATIAGRRPYFKKVVLRMWGRFLPKKITQRFQ
ncbi:hypothetical protein BGX26_005806 [Mortierella sp. AD094]|nr:hypothetical protein BGX26_005806 [Mortierella sp. AD094]